MSDPTARHARIAAATAGHRGDAAQIAAALAHPDPSVRATAVGAAQRAGLVDGIDVRSLLDDPSPIVRARAAEAAISRRDVDLRPLLVDASPTVVEAAAFALGERDDEPESIAALAPVALTHDDDLCREAAVASIGALAAGQTTDTDAGTDHSGAGAGNSAAVERALQTLLFAMNDRAPIRRRALLGLHQFDDPAAVAAVEAALDDRDRQVRTVAGELLGVGVD